jgi:hypothetical protein
MRCILSDNSTVEVIKELPFSQIAGLYREGFGCNVADEFA